MAMDDPGRHERSLTAALQTVAADDRALGASPAVEARLLAEVASIARARRRANLVGLAAAAALFAAVVLPGWYSSGRRAAVDREPAPAAEDRTREVTTVFFPLTYSHVPAPDAHLVRMQVPRSALDSFGVTAFDTPDSASSTTVLADVVVGDDGLARAVRFVRVVSYYEQQERQP
jgi:hypothetical protein